MRAVRTIPIRAAPPWLAAHLDCVDGAAVRQLNVGDATAIVQLFRARQLVGQITIELPGG